MVMFWLVVLWSWYQGVGTWQHLSPLSKGLGLETGCQGHGLGLEAKVLIQWHVYGKYKCQLLIMICRPRCMVFVLVSTPKFQALVLISRRDVKVMVLNSNPIVRSQKTRLVIFTLVLWCNIMPCLASRILGCVW